MARHKKPTKMGKTSSNTTKRAHHKKATKMGKTSRKVSPAKIGIGTIITKWFDTRLFYGMVYFIKDGNYYIRYTDGDGETMLAPEVLSRQKMFRLDKMGRSIGHFVEKGTHHEGAHEIGTVIVEDFEGKSVDGVVLGYRKETCWVRCFNGQYRRLEDDEVKKKKSVKYVSSFAPSNDHDDESDAFVPSNDKFESDDDDSSEGVSLKETIKSVPKSKSKTKQAGKKKQKHKMFFGRPGKWNGCNEVEKFLCLTGLFTRTGAPDGAPSQRCRQHLQMVKKKKDDKGLHLLFNYLVLIFSLNHNERVDFVVKLDTAEQKKSESAGDREKREIHNALAGLRSILEKFGIKHQGENNGYLCSLKEGTSAEFPDAIFEMKSRHKDGRGGYTYNSISPQANNDYDDYFIQLTNPGGLQALSGKEKLFMNSYCREGFWKECKTYVGSDDFDREALFIGDLVQSNCAMKIKSILYYSHDILMVRVLNFLFENPGKWKVESIKNAFLIDYADTTQNKVFVNLRYLFCDGCSTLSPGGGPNRTREYIRLTKNLYPEGEPEAWKSVHDDDVIPQQLLKGAGEDPTFLKLIEKFYPVHKSKKP